MSKVDFSEITSQEVAQRLTDTMTQLMKRSSGPMMEFVDQFDLSFAQLKMMFVLYGLPEPQAIGRVAELTGQSLPSAGRAVDGLVRSGLATRTEDPDDRRVKRVELSIEGERGVNAIYRERLANLNDALAQLEPEQLAALSVAIEPLAEIVTGDLCTPNTDKEAS